MDSYLCNADGSFEIEIPFEKIDVTKKYGFSASALYDFEYGLDPTSELSYFCFPDTTIVTDTIFVGEKIYGQTYSTVGIQDAPSEILKNVDGCDSVVLHKVAVRPTALNYYVKMNKENDGDGRDWDNAMSGEDFATYLPLAPDGATFYVAAGTYKPKYGYNLQTPANKSGLRYEINSSVTIIGGYPADATGTNVPSEPKKYHTVFDGDIVGDDEITETSDGDYLSVSVANRKDNSSYMFFSKSNKEIHNKTILHQITIYR